MQFSRFKKEFAGALFLILIGFALFHEHTAQASSIGSGVGTGGPVVCGQLPAFTGDMTTTAGSCAATNVGLNGTNLAGLGTGLLKNTTATGVPSIVTLPLSTANGGAVAQGVNICGSPGLCKTGSLTQAQITGLTSSAGVSVLSAAGANTAIVIDSWSLNGVYVLNYTAGSALELKYTGSGTLAANTIGSSILVSNTANTFAVSPLTEVSVSNDSTLVNVGVTLLTSGAAFSCASTCSTLNYAIAYHVLTGIQ